MSEKPIPETAKKREFHVEVIRHSHGYVRVHARNKNEARRAVEQMNKKKLLSYYKERCEFLNIGEVKPQGKMIDIHNCELEGDVTETPIFEVSGTYDNDPFSCKLELRFPPDEDPEDYEHIDGADLGPCGFDVLEELLNELYETEVYQEALEDFEKAEAESDVILD